MRLDRRMGVRVWFNIVLSHCAACICDVRLGRVGGCLGKNVRIFSVFHVTLRRRIRISCCAVVSHSRVRHARGFGLSARIELANGTQLSRYGCLRPRKRNQAP
jgi:hypothetical protein